MSGDASTRRFFATHARDYSRSPSHAHGADLAVLMQALKPSGTEVALDVATGTGFTAVALARSVRSVVGIDMTGEMLEQAENLARSEGLTNVKFELCDAMDMKFPGASFDIVATRRATHHFRDVPRFLREANRVMKPGGRLGIVDMSPPEGVEIFANRIEKLRDSSHAEAFTPSTWTSMILHAGLRITSAQVMGEGVTFERWLYPVKSGGPEEEAVKGAWTSASDDARRLLGAEFEAGVIKRWTKTRIIIIASKTT